MTTADTTTSFATSTTSTEMWEALAYNAAPNEEALEFAGIAGLERTPCRPWGYWRLAGATDGNVRLTPNMCLIPMWGPDQEEPSPEQRATARAMITIAERNGVKLYATWAYRLRWAGIDRPDMTL